MAVSAARKKSRSKKKSSTPSGKKKGGTNRNTRGRERTVFQIERQETVYDLYVMGISLRRIKHQLTTADKDGNPPRFPTLDVKTIMSDIIEERKRRVDAAGETAEHHRADAIAFYNIVRRKAIAANGMSRWIGEGVKAQERIDKIRGIDQPTKVEIGLESLLQALDAD